ncbi:MAG: RdgB/HAM1 family non-canonical purine NTP pyrophosphatase [Bacteroidota bacterium]
MPTLVFATGNPHKVEEVNQLLANSEFKIKSLKDIGCEESIPETQGTISGNALQKAQYVKTHYGLDCFAEDTGLEIVALNGEPGVDSAHYAGPERSDTANMQKVLRLLAGHNNREAQFRTVIALIHNGQTHTFEGIVKGQIRHSPSGDGGFGYDPIFEPEGFDATFAEMSRADKNAISHRGRALQKLRAFLEAN